MGSAGNVAGVKSASQEAGVWRSLVAALEGDIVSRGIRSIATFASVYTGNRIFGKRSAPVSLDYDVSRHRPIGTFLL